MTRSDLRAITKSGVAAACLLALLVSCRSVPPWDPRRDPVVRRCENAGTESARGLDRGGAEYQQQVADARRELARVLSSTGGVPRTARDLDAFRGLRKDMPRFDVHRAVGIPDGFAGSGIPYDVYVLEDCSRVEIAYPNGVLAWAFHVDPDGKRERFID